MRVRFNKEKFNSEVVEKLKPTTSWWALVGIIFFFFVPEIIAYIWGVEIKHFFLELQKSTDDNLQKTLYKKLAELLSENSLINILIGFGFVWWFFHERKKDYLNKS